jgi:hypothetical protein
MGKENNEHNNNPKFWFGLKYTEMRKYQYLLY